eukprot:2419255-Alexandrium_andersonii.AAC.1
MASRTSRSERASRTRVRHIGAPAGCSVRARSRGGVRGSGGGSRGGGGGLLSCAERLGEGALSRLRFAGQRSRPSDPVALLGGISAPRLGP